MNVLISKQGIHSNLTREKPRLILIAQIVKPLRLYVFLVAQYTADSLQERLVPRSLLSND